MKITIALTSETTEIGGVPVRLWVGQTERGQVATFAIHRVITDDPELQRELMRECRSMLPPLDRGADVLAACDRAIGEAT